MPISIFRAILLFNFVGQGALATNYIVGGQEVRESDPVRAATIGIFDPSPDGRTGSLCTGTLIRKNLVVTAAHCVPPGAAKPVLIFGRDLHSPNAIRRPAQDVAVNPKWEASGGRGMDQGDIALVKFKGGLPAGYKKVATVRSDKQIHSGDRVVLAGYGISDARKKLGAGILRKTEIHVAKNRPGKSEMILDQSHGHGACHGDSGGPAFIERNGRIRLAGVTNRSYPGGAPDDCAHQVVYTKIPAYGPWIRSRMGKKASRSVDSQSAPRLLTKKVRQNPRARSHQLIPKRRTHAKRKRSKWNHARPRNP